MPREFARSGIRLHYPDHWTLETESLAAVPATVISARTSAEPAPEIALHQGRIGLRLILRKRLIRLRHPI